MILLRAVFVVAIAALLSMVAPNALASPTAGPTSAPVIDTAYADLVADELVRSHVYVDRHAGPPITDDEVRRLQEQISATGKPIYVAFVDESRALLGRESPWTTALHIAMGDPQAFILFYTASGHSFDSYDIPPLAFKTMVTAHKQAYEASAQQHDGVIGYYEVTHDWLDVAGRIDYADTSQRPGTIGPSPQAAKQPQPTADTGFWNGWTISFAVVAVLALAAVVFIRQRRRRVAPVNRIPTARKE